MKRKIKLFSTLASLIVCICMLMIGVFAAQTISFTAVGKVTFVSDIVYADITRTVYGNKQTVEPQVFGLDGRKHIVNYFNINNVETKTDLINNGDGSLTINRYYSSSAKTLKQLCPELQVGDEVTLSATTEGGKFIYLTSYGESWFFNNSLTITDIHLNSTVIFYTQNNKDETPRKISEIQIVKTSDYTNSLKGKGENGADIFVPYNESNFASVQRKNLFDYKTEMVNAGGVLQGDGSVKVKPDQIHNGIVSWTPEEPKQRITVTATIKNENSSNESTLYFKIKYTDGTTDNSTFNNCYNTYRTISLTSSANKSIESVIWGSNHNDYTYIKDVQIEEGIEATEYEEYEEPKTVVKEYLTNNKTVEGNKLEFVNAETNIIVQFEIENLSNNRGIDITISDLIKNEPASAILKTVKVRVGDEALRVYDTKQNELEVLKVVCTEKSTTNNHKVVIQFVFSIEEEGGNVSADTNYNYNVHMSNVPAEKDSE